VSPGKLFRDMFWTEIRYRSEDSWMIRFLLGILILISMAAWSFPAQGQTVDVKDYTIYAGTEKRTLDSMVEALSQADVVFLGEQHDHTLGHRLQFDILRALYAKKPKLGLTLEMFERDVQTILDEYLAGHINENAFLQASRPWPNYKADYRPLVEFCKENRLPVVAANAPRRYVNIVSRKGQNALAELPRESKAFLPPLPYPMELPTGYDRQLNDIFGGHGQGTGSATTTPTSPAMPSTENMKQAQGLWDEAMKDSILRFQRKNRGRTIVQVNGAMHSDSGYGIVDRLRKAAPRLKVLVVTIRPDEKFPDIKTDAFPSGTDFVIVTRSEPKPNKN
jgi:uncharacterized iron-regulated protein